MSFRSGIGVAEREQRAAERARGYFRHLRGESDEQQRAAEIAALPLVAWKGRPLRTLQCHGGSGRGEHDVNVPEWVLWALIGLQPWYCPYHPAPMRAEGEGGRR